MYTMNCHTIIKLHRDRPDRYCNYTVMNVESYEIMCNHDCFGTLNKNKIKIIKYYYFFF